MPKRIITEIVKKEKKSPPKKVKKVKKTSSNTNKKTRKSSSHTKTHKCSYISPALECMIGGFGTLGCLNPKTHIECDIKKEKLLNISYPIKKYKTTS